MELHITKISARALKSTGRCRRALIAEPILAGRDVKRPFRPTLSLFFDYSDQRGE